MCEFEMHLKNSCFHLHSNLIMMTWFLPNQAQPVPGSKIVASAGLRKHEHKNKTGRVSYWDDFLISYRVYMMTGSFHILLFEGTLHIDKIHMWFKIANITQALLVPVYWQTDFTLFFKKCVVILCLHDTVVRFRTGVNFSPWYNNRGELTLG